MERISAWMDKGLTNKVKALAVAFGAGLVLGAVVF